MKPRRALHALLVAATAGGLVVAAAVPGSAGGAGEKKYKAKATTGAGSTIVTTSGLAGLTVVDDLDGDHSDLISGSASRSENLEVKTESCKSSDIAFYGEAKHWANMADTAPAASGRMRLYCTYSDGTKHSFHWGMTKLTSDGTGDPDRTNCLVLSRMTAAGVNPTLYTVSTPDPAALEQCPALHEVMHRNGTKTVIDAAEHVPFHITFTVSGAVPIA